MRKGILRQFFVAIICDLLIIDCGFHEGWSTPMIPKFGNIDPIAMTPQQGTWAINLLYVGTALGSLATVFLMNRIGRKLTLLITAIPKIASWIIFALATHYTTIYIGRIFAGISNGITYAVLPMYLGEITSKEIRGLVTTLISFLVNLGVLIIYAIGLYMDRLPMSMIGLVVPIVFCLGFVWCPESAFFLIRKNRLHEAERTLRWTLQQEEVGKDLDEIKRVVSIENEYSRVKLLDICKNAVLKRENRRAWGIAFIMMTAMTWSGATPILAYQSYIYESGGFELTPNISIIITGTANIISGIACMLTIKCLGKRRILLIAGGVMTISLLVLSMFFSALENGANITSFRWVPSLFVMLFTAAYGFGINPLTFAYISEIFVYEMKVPAGLITAIYYAISCVGAVAFYQDLSERYGTYVPFWCFSVITAVLWLAMYLYVPETERKTIEEILLELKGKARDSKTDKKDKIMDPRTNL